MRCRSSRWVPTLIVVAALGAAAAGPQKASVFPGADWERWRSPEAAGFSSQRLAALRKAVEKLGTSAMVVVSGGRLVFEYGNTADASYVASVRKSVLAMLFGKYVEDGRITLEKTLADLRITDRGGLSPGELQATVGDLLAARSGVYHPASNGGDDAGEAPPRGSKTHGTYFLYNNWDFNALGTIFEQETRRNVYDALESDLARPIGMQDFRRDRQEKVGDLEQSVHLAYHMVLSTRDMARLGYLMLREGRWAGQQVVPARWARRIVTAVTPSAEMNPAAHRDGPFGYGLLWWVLDGRFDAGAYEGAYTAIGAGGQFITVLPRIDLVVAHKVKMTPDARPVSANQYFTLLDDLIAARTAPLPPVEAGRSGINRLSPASLRAIDAAVTTTLADCRLLNLALVRGGTLVLTRAYGAGRLDAEYEYASVSKPITSTIVMQLRGEGKIRSLDDNVWAYLPRYRDAMPEAYRGAPLTIEQLLTHRSGIPHNDKPPMVEGRLNLQFEPGARMLYSTPGYGILGEVIEAVTGLSYGDAVRKYVGDPVGARSFRAIPTFIAPGAYVLSTIEDMGRFAMGVMDGRYMPANVLYEEVLRPASGTYGYGWGVSNPGTEALMASHAGSNGLPRAHILLVPHRKDAVVILAQARTYGPLDLDALARTVLAVPTPRATKTTTKTTDTKTRQPH